MAYCLFRPFWLPYFCYCMCNTQTFLQGIGATVEAEDIMLYRGRLAMQDYIGGRVPGHAEMCIYLRAIDPWPAYILHIKSADKMAINVRKRFPIIEAFYYWKPFSYISSHFFCTKIKLHNHAGTEQGWSCIYNVDVMQVLNLYGNTIK